MSLFRRAPFAWAVAAVVFVAGAAFNAALWIDRDELLGRLESRSHRLERAYRQIEDLQAEAQGLRAENRTLTRDNRGLRAEILECLDAIRASVRLYNALVGELNAIGELDPAEAEAREAEAEAFRDQANDALDSCTAVRA